VSSYGWTENNDLIYAKINGVEYGKKTNVKESQLIPGQFVLFQNYPNPFNPSTTIKYDIPTRSNVRIEVFDVLGRRAEVLLNKEQEHGKYSVSFSADKLSAGIYFYKITTNNFIQTKKMVVIK
jgi:hypothetical protein